MVWDFFIENLPVPLNLKLTVGDVIELNFGYITKEAGKKGTKDKQKSGYYLIKELSHLFEQGQHKGWTALKLIRDSYGEPAEWLKLQTILNKTKVN